MSLSPGKVDDYIILDIYLPALRVKRQDADGFNFSFFPRISRMVASTVARIILLSLAICVTAVLGSPHLEKRGGLLQ